MITLTCVDGRKLYLEAKSIAEVLEASTSSQWHGIRSYVKTFEGRIFEVRERSEDIVREWRRQEML